MLPSFSSRLASLDSGESSQQQQSSQLFSYLRSRSPPTGDAPALEIPVKSPINLLYRACREAFDAILEDSSLVMRVKEEEGRFTLWSNDFPDCKTDRLDMLLHQGNGIHLQECICIALVTILQPQLLLLRGYLAASDTIRNAVEAQEAAADIITRLRSHIEIADDTTSNESDDEPDLSDILCDLKDAISSLYSLVPTLEAFYLGSEKHHTVSAFSTKSISTAAEIEDDIQLPASFYSTIIRDKFPDLDTRLVEILGKQNGLRHRRLRQLEEVAKQQEQAEKRQPAPSEPGKDSGLGSSVHTFEFQPPLIAPSYPKMFVEDDDAKTESSWGTTHSQVSGKARIPKPPVDLVEGVVFQCNICFKTIRDVDTMLKWKKHVLKDIRPYSCLFPDCPDSETTFASRKQWQTHEWKLHRPQKLSRWECRACPDFRVFGDKTEIMNHMINEHLGGDISVDLTDIVARFQVQSSITGEREKIQCLFCPEVLVETRAVIQSHLGQHMDEIALKALPQGEYASDEEDSEGENQSIHEDLGSVASMVGQALEKEPSGETPETAFPWKGIPLDVYAQRFRSNQLFDAREKEYEEDLRHFHKFRCEDLEIIDDAPHTLHLLSTIVPDIDAELRDQRFWGDVASIYSEAQGAGPIASQDYVQLNYIMRLYYQIIEPFEEFKRACTREELLAFESEKRLHLTRDELRRPGPEYESEDSENIPKNEQITPSGWKCLFYEHDPTQNPQCGERRFKTASGLRRHIKTHTLPYYCATCGYRTSEERRLMNHKCAEGNRRRYAPLTEHDRKKHAELAKTGYKVGHMKLILFGPGPTPTISEGPPSWPRSPIQRQLPVPQSKSSSSFTTLASGQRKVSALKQTLHELQFNIHSWPQSEEIHERLSWQVAEIRRQLEYWETVFHDKSFRTQQSSSRQQTNQQHPRHHTSRQEESASIPSADEFQLANNGPPISWIEHDYLQNILERMESLSAQNLQLWHRTLPLEDRLANVLKISTYLQVVRSNVRPQSCLEVATDYEEFVFNKRYDRVEQYATKCAAKLMQIRTYRLPTPLPEPSSHRPEINTLSNADGSPRLNSGIAIDSDDDIMEICAMVGDDYEELELWKKLSKSLST